MEPPRPSLWERYAVPALVDWGCGVRPVRRQRDKVVPLAEGRVLELGVGTGHNLACYDPARVEAVVGIDPSPPLLERAAKAAREAPVDVELVQGSAEALPFDDASFDTVVVTYTLCSIPDAVGALREARRALQPGGALRFVEHGLAPDPDVAAWQRRIDPMWTRTIGGGCHLDRDIPALLVAAGFEVDRFETCYLPGPRWLNFNYWGAAR